MVKPIISARNSSTKRRVDRWGVTSSGGRRFELARRSSEVNVSRYIVASARKLSCAGGVGSVYQSLNDVSAASTLAISSRGSCA